MNIYYKIIADINKRLPDILSVLQKNKLKIVVNPRTIYDIITYRDIEKYGNMKLMKYMKSGIKYLCLEKGNLLTPDLITRVHVLVEKDNKLYLYCLIDRVEQTDLDGQLIDAKMQLRPDNIFDKMSPVSENTLGETNKLEVLKDYVNSVRYELDLPLKLSSNDHLMVKPLSDVIETRFNGKLKEHLELVNRLIIKLTYKNIKIFNSEFQPNISSYDIFKIKVIEGADYIYKVQNVKGETLYFVIDHELYLLLGLPQEVNDTEQLLYSYCKVPLTDKLDEEYIKDLFSKLVNPKQGIRIPVQLTKHTFDINKYECHDEPVAESLTRENIMNMDKIPYGGFDKLYEDAKEYWDRLKKENDPENIKPTLAYIFCLADRMRTTIYHYESPMKGEELKYNKKVLKDTKSLFKEIQHYLSIREPDFDIVQFMSNSKYSPLIKGITGIKTSAEVRKRYTRTMEKLL